MYLYLPGYCDSRRKCTLTTPLLAYINAWWLIEMFSYNNPRQISVLNWVAFWMQCNNSPTFVTQPHHFAIAYLCLYLYTKKLFMRKSHVPGIDSCVCIPSKELIRRLVWRLMKCSNECHILSLKSQIRNTARITHK